MKNTMKNIYELIPVYDSRASFYGKALIEKTKSGEVLYSYLTPVAGIENGKPWSAGFYSATTARHQKEFFKQHGFNIKEVEIV